MTKSRGQSGAKPAGPSSLGNGPLQAGPIVKPKSTTTDQGVPPLVMPQGASAPIGRGLIRIGGDPSAAIRASEHKDPFAFWMDYYKKHDDPPGNLHEAVRLLGHAKRMRDVEAALKGYLWNRGNNAEAWMYRALALAMQVNHGSAADIQTALNYAADLAQKSHNPNDLVSVADTMFLMGQLNRVGVLLDEAAEKIPHRNEPLKMSVNLARIQRDPARMGRTIEQLLALGWPGEDEYIRNECRNQVEKMATALREEGRTREAADLEQMLRDALGRDLYIRLTWDGYADYDLAVDEPLGVTASYDLPRTVFGGSILKNGYGLHPEEVYVCPRGFDGDYTIHIRTIALEDKKPTIRLKVETILHEGTPHEERRVVELRPDQLDRPIVVHLSAGRRKKTLPYIDPLAGRLEYQAKGRSLPAKRKPRRQDVPRAAAKPGS